MSQFSHAIDLAQFPSELNWQSVLIIPVCGESPTLLETVMKVHENSQVLIILCLNRPDHHPKTDQWHQDNHAVVAHIQQQAHKPIRVGQHQLLLMDHSWDCLLLNFNEAPFNANHGVGLARKTAADTALALIERKQIKTPWIHSTDADVTLPQGYFDVVDQVNGACAISLPFEHVGDDDTLQSLQEQYDFKLKYYQWGMRHIGVAYDYIPLGSTLAVSASAYASVRGFPVRSGGEDFYLLNKLAKIGQVAQPPHPIIAIKSRFSDRVPFGTGPALQKYRDSESAALYYHPNCFEIIKQWRQKLLAQYHQIDIMETATADEAMLNHFWSWSKTFDKNKKQIKTVARWQQFIHEWLDAFKLLKSVHQLRERYPDVPRSSISIADDCSLG